MSRFLALAFACVLLAACASMPAVPAPAAQEATPTESAATSAPTENSEAEVFTAAFLLAESPTDQGWNAAHYRGIEALKSLGEVVAEENLSFAVDMGEKGLLDVVVFENVGYSDADIERVMRSVLNQQSPDILFATWFDAKDAIARLAPEYPDVYFEHSSGYPLIHSGDNLSTYFIRQEYGDYVAGYVTGLLGYTKTGLVGTFAIPEPVRGINGYGLGLQQGLSEAGIDPAQSDVRVVWINSWLDPVQEREAALALADTGVEVVRQMADTPHSSQAACSVDGMVAVGYGTDVSAYAPCALMTNEWNWGAYYVQRIEDAMSGAWTAQDWWGGFEEDAIGISGWNDALVPAEVQSKALALVAEFEGGFDPFCGPIRGHGRSQEAGGENAVIEVPAGQCLSDMDLLTIQWFVDGISGELPPAPADGFSLELKPE